MNNDLFSEINNALIDLQASQTQTYERPLKTLGRLLRSQDLTEINSKLTDALDLETFLKTSDATTGGMVGSARLLWPDDPIETLGLTLLLIYKLADDPEYAINFGFHYYYSGNKTIAGIHSIVRQLLIPFVRDYRAYISNSLSLKRRPIIGSSNRIFIVHGHDAEARESVARFLQAIDLVPVILHEQANKGRTVIEKVEDNADVGFAVVLLTPDDEGRSKGGELESRARQNVLLELGYFMGVLGRDRVCSLMKGSVEVPSDFAGVVWESMDAGAWKQSLGRELEAAGYKIEWNKVMR